MNIHEFLKECKFRISKEEAQEFYKKRDELLKEDRLQVVDVGAASGLLPHWEKFKHFADIYAIEPDKRSSQLLKEKYKSFKNYKVIEEALGDKNSEVELFLTNVPTGSSLLEPMENFIYHSKEDSYFFPYKKEKIKTLTFKTILNQYIKNDVDAIKLDIQGYEYHIIKSIFFDDIKNILLFEFEVGIPGAYKNQKQFYDIDKLMQENDYELYDIRTSRAYFPKDRIDKNLDKYKIIDDSPKISAKLVELDVIYFKKLSWILDKKDKNLVIKMMMLLNSYNFFYEATYLVEEAGRIGIFSDKEVEVLSEFVWTWYRVLEEEPLYTDRTVANKMREHFKSYQLKNAFIWHRYMYQNYPN
jgi:FkbM family methyltransferase